MAETASTSHLKQFKRYFTPAEVERLSAKQRGKLSVSREERGRQQACGFLDAVGVRCGFPRKTIATAQTLYMRFHLFFPYKEFNYIEVCLSALYVSSKLHDTLKKPRDIILSSYAIRFPNLVKKGNLDPASVDPNMLEGERKRVLSIERLVLESVCFSFRVETDLGLVIKLSKDLSLSRDLAQLAWSVNVDCYRTLAPLSFTLQSIALASIYTACMLLLVDSRPHDMTESAPESHEQLSIIRQLGDGGDWVEKYSADVGEVDEVAHLLIDLYALLLSSAPEVAIMASPSPVSPRDNNPDPASQANAPSPAQLGMTPAFRLPTYWTAQTLTELKIHLRERQPDAAHTAAGWPEADSMDSEEVDDAVVGLGKNDGTVRFVWDAVAA